MDFEPYVQYGKQNLVIFEKECNITIPSHWLPDQFIISEQLIHRLQLQKISRSGEKTSIFAHRTTSILDHSHSQETLFFTKTPVDTARGTSQQYLERVICSSSHPQEQEKVKNQPKWSKTCIFAHFDHSNFAQFWDIPQQQYSKFVSAGLFYTV